MLTAYVAGSAALLVFGVPAALQQQRHSPIVGGCTTRRASGRRTAWHRAVRSWLPRSATNVAVNTFWPGSRRSFSVHRCGRLGRAARHRHGAATGLRLLPSAVRSSVFLLALVLTASLMPVHELPPPSWQSSFTLGLVSAVFDNIPLTAMALQQGGYDWAMLAYAVGFGGSMIWFGSSAGVALCGVFPQGRSVVTWVRAGWHVAVAYAVGFLVYAPGLAGVAPRLAGRRGRGLPAPTLAEAFPFKVSSLASAAGSEYSHVAG